jgi:hypothetical protein
MGSSRLGSILLDASRTIVSWAARGRERVKKMEIQSFHVHLLKMPFGYDHSTRRNPSCSK